MAEVDFEASEHLDRLASHRVPGKVDDQDQAEALDDTDTRTFSQLPMRPYALDESSAQTEDSTHDLSNELNDAVTVDRSPGSDDAPSSHQELEGRDVSIHLETVNDKKSRTRMAQKIAPRLLLLFVCFAYLAISVMTIDIGLGAISKHLEVRLDKARIQLKASIDDRYREKVLYHQLDTITSTPLSRGFMETYEECLVRGLQTVDSQMPVSGWIDYADIRNQTIKWTTENCGRLLVAPQVMDPTAQQVISMYLVNACHHSHQIIVKIFEFIMLKTSLLLDWWYGGSYIDVVPVEEKGNSSVQNMRRTSIKIPFGFNLQCDGSVPCRLVYPLSHCLGRVKKAGNNVSKAHDDQCFDKRKTSENTAVRAHRRVANLTFFHTKIRKAMEMNTAFLHAFICCECIWAITYLLATISLLDRPFPLLKPRMSWFNIRKAFRHASKEANYAIGTTIIQFCALMSYTVMGRFSCDECHVACLVGIALFICGISQLLNFLFPIKQVEDIFQIFNLIKELYHVIRNRNVNEKQETNMSFEPANPDANVINLPNRLVSPTTTIQQAIWAINHHHTEHSPALLSDSTTVMYSGSDTEDEHASGQDTDDEDVDSETFVDLAGGVTPTALEASSGWSVVDA